MIIHIILTLLMIIFVFYVYLSHIKRKINLLEEKIQRQFLERTDLIPSLYEVSREHLTKHNQIFDEILELRKKEFAESIKYNNLHIVIKTKKIIHHEINFLFKIFNKHKGLTKEGKFIYLRNLIIKKSFDISKDLEKYKVLVKQLNKLIDIKNRTILGLIFPLRKKVEL